MAALHDEMQQTLGRLGGRRPSIRALRERVADFEERTLRNPERLRALARRGWPFAAAGVLAAGVAAFFVLRPTPVPDYEDAPIDTLMSFTLLQAEFNRLPIERRLELVGMLVSRLEGMSGSDSLLLAAFAGSIRGEAREQLEENASRLAIDLWDSLAVEYETVALDDREAFLADAFVRFEQATEVMSGNVRDRDPEERLRRGRAQAKRDQEMMRSGNGPPSRVAGRLFDVMSNDIGGHATPLQRQRGHQLMRDMTRFLRGQDIATGGG
ncbi:MAG: hypothetical protein AAFX79_09515 [Planctomycetota bacterium]